MNKLPFDIDLVLGRIEAAVRPFPRAAMFELRERGFGSLWEQLAACVLSIRTLDEVSLAAAERLFERARTPAEHLQLTPDEVLEVIRPSTFAESKVDQLREMAERTVAEHGGKLPCDFQVLTNFRGIGPKCANLSLGIACEQPRISVDIHVHRVSNRWGYVAAPTPEGSLDQLEGKLPKEHRIEINRLLVPFGKHICTGRLPGCSTCPVLEFCGQVGVTAHR